MIASPLDRFADDARWIAWRNEVRAGAKPGDKATKIPYSAHGGRAKADDPSTWSDKKSAERLAKRLVNGQGGGLGIELGDLGSDLYLAGADVDTCLRALEQGGAELADWAKPILGALKTYVERSPSLSGVKAYFLVEAADVRWFLDKIGVAAEQWGCRRSIPGHDPRNHGAAVEIYLSHRYFAVTGDPFTGTPRDLAIFDRDDLDRLAALIPPGRKDDGKDGGPDGSRSAIALRKGLAFCRQHPGCTFAEMAEALLNDPDTADWVREKGEAAGGRELKRIWDKARREKEVADPADWPEPAVFKDTAPTPSFPKNFLPGALGEYADAQAFDLQVPTDFIGIPLLIAAATAIGKEFRMAPKVYAPWSERACVWGGIIGFVGDGKTPSFNTAFAPIWRLQKQWREEFHEEFKSHTAAVKIAKILIRAWERAAAAAVKKGEEPPTMPEAAETPEEPTCRELITNDTTQERLAQLMMHNPRGLMLYRDELSGWFRSFNQYRPGADEQFYLQCHGGGAWVQHRKGGPDVIVADVYFNICGGFQPDVVAEVLARRTGKADSGMAARFSLLVWPDHMSRKWVDNSPDRDLHERINRLFEHFANSTPSALSGPGKRQHIIRRCVSPPKRTSIFQDWYHRHHQAQDELGDDAAALKGHFAKYDGLFASLSLVHHLLRYAQGEKIEPARVDAVTASAVRDFIDGYLRRHARKIYRHLARDPGFDGAQRIAQWIVENPEITSFKRREVSRKEWAGLTGRDENTGKDFLRASLDYLENVAGWVRAEEVPSGPRGGRPTLVYHVNPQVVR